MGNPDYLTITGGTPEQEAILREIFAWPAVPDPVRPVHVNLGPGYPNHGGYTGLTMADSFEPSVDHVGTTFLHEYGHTWDKQCLSIYDRQALMDLHDMPYSWYGGPYMERPAERGSVHGEASRTVRWHVRKDYDGKRRVLHEHPI